MARFRTYPASFVFVLGLGGLTAQDEDPVAEALDWGGYSAPAEVYPPLGGDTHHSSNLEGTFTLATASTKQQRTQIYSGV